MYSNSPNLVRPFQSSATLPVLTSTGVMAYRFIVQEQCKVKRIGIAISTTMSSSGNTVVACKKRPLIGSSSGESTIGTLNIVTATAAGNMVYLDVSGVVLAPGQEICFDVTTAATSAGAGIPVLVCEDDPEYKSNQSTLVASA